MKKIIIFCMFIISLLLISSNIKSKVDENLKITSNIDVLIVEKEIYETIKVILDNKYNAIEYGLYEIKVDVIDFYVTNEVQFEQLNLDKEVVIKDVNEFDVEKISGKYLNLYFDGDKQEIIAFYNEFDQYLTTANNSMNVDSRLISLESGILNTSKLPIYQKMITITILFLTSIIILYAFVHFNNKSKSIAINKLYDTNAFTKSDFIFIFSCFIMMLVLNLCYSIFLFIFVGLIYLMKYFLYYKCIVIRAINGKPIVNNFETVILLYNTIIKILIFSFYVLFLLLIPRIYEYHNTYELWKNVEDYSLTSNAFIECCGNDNDATGSDEKWRSEYYNFMRENYEAILIPVQGGGPNTFTGNDYEVSKRFFDIQGIEININEEQGALIVRDIDSESTKLIIENIKVLAGKDSPLVNIPIIVIGDEKIYTFDPLIGYDSKASYLVYPNEPLESTGSFGYVLNSNQIIYKNSNQDNQALDSFYSSVLYDAKIKVVDPSFYKLGHTQIEQFIFIINVALICFIFIIFINLFLTKNIIDMYEEKNIKLNTVRKILGYSNFQVHKNFYITYHFIDGLIAILVIIISLFLGVFIYGLLLAGIHLIISLFTSYLYISKNEKDKVVEALKGKI